MTLRALAIRKHSLLARSALQRAQMEEHLLPAVRIARVADRVVAAVRVVARLAPLYALLRR